MRTRYDEVHDFLMERLRAILSYFPPLGLHNNEHLTAEEINFSTYRGYKGVQRVFDEHYIKLCERDLAFMMGTHGRTPYK